MIWDIPAPYTYFFVGALSLCVGSFLNVLIYRLPLMLQRDWKAQCRVLLHLQPSTDDKPINLFLPRSFCTHCKHPIHARHNIPLLSYLVLRGRCAYCKQRIGFRYPLVEGLTLSVSLMVLFQLGWNIHTVCALPFIWLLIALAWIDIDHQLLPDSLTLLLLWLGLLVNTQAVFIPLEQSVWSAASAYMMLWSVMGLFKIITGKTGMGHGDFKLFAAISAWTGFLQMPLILLLSSLSGLVCGVLYLRIQNKDHQTPIPFGPFLCLSGIFSLLYGHSMAQWYLSWWGL